MLLRGPQGFMLTVSFGVSMVLLTLARFEQSQQLETGIGGTRVLVDDLAHDSGPPAASSAAGAQVSKQAELTLGDAAAGAATLADAGASEGRLLPGGGTALQVVSEQPEWLQDASAHLWSAKYRSAMGLLFGRLHPAACSAATVMRIPIGRGGGLGSMFQWSAKMFSAVLTEPAATVAIFEGQLKAYTSNPMCREITDGGGGGWPCFYEQLSNCTAKSGAKSKRFDWKIRGEKQKAEYRSLEPGVVASIPDAFTATAHGATEAEAGFWWGALQGYAGRLNPRMRARLAVVKHALDYGEGDRAPKVAMHIRLGDKQADGQSKQAGVAGAASDYFKQADVLVARVQRQECGTGAALKADACAQVGVYIATDSAAAVAASRAWAATNSAVRLVIAGSTASQNVSASAAEVAKVIGKRDDAYSIAEEVVLDLNLLLGPPHFVGLCMSQLARYVVGVGFARGTLKTATAMDHNRIQKKDQFKLGVEAVPWRPPTSI